ncbi:acyl-CoA dehydrogenase family protein [Xanthobacter flavus]|uniref:acyl-CoA dehydrogenase family protein n=1 Tax=Xanthobacter flavus TaxID=281 RepID=UPI001AE60F6F|nr:acyl-CoA dehydrogenase family protein [Xanthobacter flavus]MBP2151148.1 alkylation response protein AidB-like acyl-CoA dehydrogenase [Xanthobacter flavus]
MIEPTPEQVLMRDSLVQLLGDGVARTRSAGEAWPRIDRAPWADIAGAGWPGLLVPEASGGWGGTALDMVMLLEGAAATLAPEPLPAVLAIAPLLAACESAAAAALLGQLVSGEAIVLMAESGAFPLSHEAGFVLFDAHWADEVICAEGEGDAFRLVAVPAADLADAPLRRTIDGSGQRVFSLPAGAGLELARGCRAEAAYHSAVNRLRLGAAASLMGLVRGALALTIDYLGVRTQFGQPIGSFQALQHRAASLHVAHTAGWALVCEAALSVGGEKEGIACAMVKAKASSTARDVLKDCVQMHGAIGFSDEYALAPLFRRAVTLASAFGTSQVCLGEIGSLPRCA